MTTLSAASATIDVPELSDLSHDKVLASARFTKSLRARSQQGFVFVKALMKPYSAFDVGTYVKQLTDERNALASIPNALGYQRIVETATGGFLVRQYMYSSVYDRLSTRPFLEDIEKRWLSYQLLCAVRDCHAQNLYHGDIKTENLLVTSWNWLYLTDFSACFKPTTLPEDNPADFSFYFDTSSRRVCYVAPERFTSSTSDEVFEELNWAMDMFSVGCAIAEIFLEGPIFTLSQIFKYKTREYSPTHFHINKIEDPEVRAMISNMIDLDPEKRYSAEQHLSFYKSKIFPEYFYNFLHDYVQDLTEPASGEPHLTLDSELLFESDRKIDRVYHDYDKVSYFLGYSAVIGDIDIRSPKPLKPESKTLEGHIDNALHDGTLLFLTLVSSGIRNTSKASARLKACELLGLFARRLPDEAKLDRILPYIVGLLSDKSDVVKVAALHATTSILDSVKVVSPVNAYLFPEYLLPRFRQFLSTGQSRPSALVRAAYASCLATLALASARMLDMVQAVRADGRMSTFSNDIWAPESSFHGLYDVARAELIPHFEEATTLLITDSDTSVRRALLGSISRLCLFFESVRASDVILSHLNTYLNEPDWMLKCAFYDALVGVATYIGTSSLEQFVLPIMTGSMADAEHFIVEKVIRALSRMAALGLFQRSILWELAGLITRYLCHPSIWIREAAAQFVEQACKFLSTADRYCIMLPILQPFLKAPLLDFGEASILDKLKQPLSRAVFEAAVLWASKRDRSLFWTAASQDRCFMIANSDASFAATNFAKRFPARIPPSHKDKGDIQSLETLRNFGFAPDDEVKLMALREYILKFSQHKSENSVDERQRMLGDILSLAQLDVKPQNVFFDTVQPYRPVKKAKSMRSIAQKEQSRTIADALLDASINEETTISRAGQISQAQKPSARNIPGHSARDSQAPDEQFPASARRQPKIHVDGATDEPNQMSASSSGRYGLLDVDRLSADRRGSKQLGHRHSTINLLNRADAMKADAEISTNPEVAFGKLDRSPTDKSSNRDSSLTQSLNTAEKSRSRSPMSQNSAGGSFEANHNYTGDEPAVMKLLDNHLYDSFPLDLYDFGPSRLATDVEVPIKSATTPIPNASQIAVTSSVGNRQAWRPSGLLLSQFVEHTAAINCVVPAPDHTFFVTASDDGTCKVWDTLRLEKNVSARSRFTHRHGADTKVKCLCFVQDTHTFISAATDGSVQAVRIDITLAESGEAVKFGKPVLVRDWQIPQDFQSSTQAVEHASCMYHYRENSSNSILLIATSLSRILVVDMKNMDVVRSMQNPLHHGIPTTLCLDRKHHWMMLGTTHGILDLWDLRFKLRLRSFGIGGAGSGSRIDKLLLHPSRGHGKWIIASCGGEISIWDIEKLTCREVLRPSSFNPISMTKVRNYDPWLPDDESSEQVLQHFAQSIAKDDTLLQPILDQQAKSENETPSNESTISRPHASSITSLCVFSDYLTNAAQPDNPNKTTLMLSVGNDRTLRYWDLAHVDQSFIVSGPMINVVGEENRTKPRYETSWPTSMSLSGLVQLVEEKLSDGTVEEPSSARSTPRKKRDGSLRTAGVASKQVGDAAKGGKMPRNAIISAAQEQLLKTHMDGITDVCLLRKPYGCIVSVDRGGSIFVFH